MFVQPKTRLRPVPVSFVQKKVLQKMEDASLFSFTLKTCIHPPPVEQKETELSFTALTDAYSAAMRRHPDGEREGRAGCIEVVNLSSSTKPHTKTSTIV